MFDLYQDFAEEDQIVHMTKYLPVEDEISKRVEKVESINKQKEKNRVVEYLIMVSAEMTNSIASKPHRLC